jgi:sulfite exporter TauE/SafE
MPQASVVGHHRLMQNNGSAEAQALKPDAERDRSLQVLMLEYGTLRAEILMRLSARYQFIGFITAAAALIGVAIGYSSGLKVWLLTVVTITVVVAGLYGYFRMVLRGKLISARVAEIEDRINKLVPVEPGTPNLLSWESEHQNEPLFTALFDYRQLRLRMKSAKRLRPDQMLKEN